MIEMNFNQLRKLEGSRGFDDYMHPFVANHESHLTMKLQ